MALGTYNLVPSQNNQLTMAFDFKTVNVGGFPVRVAFDLLSLDDLWA